jgi:hypothetical protein
MSDRPLPRLVDDGRGLQVFRPVDRMVVDGEHLTVTPPPPPSRFADDGDGLLVTAPGALTAAADPGDPADHEPDPWQEQRLRAAADLARWEARLETATRRALSAWTAVCATAVLEDRYAVTAAGNEQLPPDPNAIPPLRSVWAQIAGTHIVRAIGDLLGEVFARFLRDEHVVSARPWQEQYLETVANRLVSVADSTFELVRGVVTDGIDAGASIPDIRDRVQESLDAGGEVSWAHRARTIARTETIGAYNGGHLAAWSVLEEETGEPVHKVWLATIDPRTRDSHFAADGQRRPLGEPFDVGSASLAHPGDPTGPAGEVINCRCTMLELDPDEPTPDTANRGFRDADEVAAEIARRAEQDPPVVRAYDAPADGLTAAAAPPPGRPTAELVARMDDIFQASYRDTRDPLLHDEARVDPALVAELLGDALTAAGLGGLAKGNFFDPNQKRDENGRWTRHGSGISIVVKDSKGRDAGAVDASFADPTEALARVTWEHELTGSDGKTYRTEITKVDGPKAAALDDHGVGYELKVRGSILGEDGFVGEFVRYVRSTPDGPEVYHGELRIRDEKHQGMGLGSAFNQKAEAVYRAAGVTHVTLDATSNPATGYVGGYVWARRGYGWADPGGARNVAKELRRISPKGADPAVDAVYDRLSGGDVAAMPTPFEVSELTSKPLRMSLPPDGNVGRAALLKSTWAGVRWLPADEPAPADDRADSALTKAGGSGKTSPSPVLRDADADALVRGMVTADLPERSQQAVNKYGGMAYLAVNSALRKGTLDDPATPDWIREDVALLREVASDHRLPAPVEVHRGMLNASRILPPRGEAVGVVVTDPSFMSTSTERDVARDFTSAQADGALFRLTVPAGHPAIPLDQLKVGAGRDPKDLAAGYGREFEVVLPPGVSFRITGEHDEDGVRVVTAEVLPYGSDEGLAAQEAAKTVRAPSTADPAKLTPAQEKALGWVAAEWGVNGKGPQPNAGVLRRLADAGLVTDPESGRWRDAELTDAGRAALGLDPADDDTLTPPAPLVGRDALVSASSTVTRPLTDDEEVALYAYTSAAYARINGHLRGTDPEPVSAKLVAGIDALRGLAAEHRLPEPVTVYRGIDGAGVLPPAGSAVGSVVTDPGFMSTSVDGKMAAGFADLEFGDDTTVLRLTAPAGHPVLPVDRLLAGDRFDPDVAAQGEAELAFPPGSAFRITADERDDDGRRVVTAEVLPYPDAPAAPPDGNADRAPDPAPAADVAPAPAAALEARDDIDALLSDMVTEDLDPDGYMALNSYALTGSVSINEHLRGVRDGSTVHQDVLTEIDALRAAADANRLPRAIVVTRGMANANEVLPEGTTLGAVVTDPGFMSTTSDPAISAKFSGSSRDRGATLRLTVPEGHPVLPVDRLLAGVGEDLAAEDEREFEVILPPGSSFRVVSDERDADGWRVITGEVVPYDPAVTDSGADAGAPRSAEAVAEEAVSAPTPGDAPAPPAREFRPVGGGDPAAGDAWLRANFDPKALSKPQKEAIGYWTSGNYKQVNELLRTGSLELRVMTDMGRFELDPAVGYERRVSPAVYETRVVHTPDDIRALAAAHYSGNDSTLVRLANQLDNLPGALDAHRTSEDLALFRVAAMPELAAASREDLLGRTITDRGFVATSTSDKSAVLVTSEALGVAGDGVVLFEIRTPAGTPFATPELPMGTVNGTKLGGYTAVQEVLLHPSEFRVVDVLDDTVDTSGYSLKNGSKVKPDKKAKRPATAVRRIVVERIGDAPPLDPPAPEPDAPAAPATVDRVTVYSKQQAREALELVDRSTTGGEFTGRALADADLFGDLEVLAAEDADGFPLAALSLVRHEAAVDGDQDFLLISYLGSTAPGAGRALVDEAVQRATETNSRLYLEATPDSAGFWKRMGAVEDPYGEGAYYLGFPGTFAGQEPDEDTPAPAVADVDAEPVLPELPAAPVELPAEDTPPVPVPAVNLTAARVAALEFYSTPPGDRSGKAPNYSVYMPLVRGGLVTKDDDGRLVLTDAGRATLAPRGDASAVPLEGEDAYASLPRHRADDARTGRALNAYQGNGYGNLNDALRSLGGDATEAEIAAFMQTGPGGGPGGYSPPHAELVAEEVTALRADLDAAFADDSAVVTRPFRVTRGSQGVAAFLPETLVPGTVIRDPGYLSTTTDPEVADRFILFGGDDAALFDITVPAGARALQVTGREAGDAEREALLPRGTELRVTDDRVVRHIVNPVAYERYVDQGRAAGLTDAEIEENARGRQFVMMVRRVSAEVVVADDRRDASPAPAAAPAPAPAPAAPAPAPAAPDADAAAAERAAAEAKAAKKAAAAAKRAEARAAKEEAARAAALADTTDGNGYPLALSYDYLLGLDDDAREDLEVALIEGLAAGDPLAEARLEDLTLFTAAQGGVDRVVEDLAGADDVTIDRAVNDWLEANGRPGLTHPAVGGTGAPAGSGVVPSMKEVRQEYAEFLHQQYLAAEDATRGTMLNKAGRRRMEKGTLSHFDMFSSPRGVADVMQYASDELLDWFTENRRIAWAEFYYERTRSPGYAEKAAKARDLSARIDRDRNALEHIHVPRQVRRASAALVAAAAAPAGPVEPTRRQLEAFAAGRAAYDAGAPLTTCPHPAVLSGDGDPEGLFALWVRGYIAGKRAAFTARRILEGAIADPATDRLAWNGTEGLLVIDPPPAVDPSGRLVARTADLVLSDLTAPAGDVGQTVTAAGFGPGDPSTTEGRPRMPRTWRSAPHLAPFGIPTGDGRIFKVGSLEARELPLPLLFQPSSGFGHDGSVVVGRILDVSFTDAGIVASGDYLDADPATAPDLSKAVEQAVALTEAGLGHVSVDLSDVVGELVDEDGNPITMEELFDAWDRGEEPVVLEQVSEGKLIACTQVATPAFEGAKIELVAAAAADVDGEAALTDADGVEIAVGAVVDVDTADGTVRGRVTAVDEEADSVTVQPTDDEGADAGDPIVVASAAVTVITAAPAAADVDEAAESLLAAAGPLRPPAEWFADPKLTAPTALTITDDGRVYGHVALWGACHVGFSNTCVTPPTSPSGYSYFHVGEVVCDDGSRVAVGNLTLGGKHADVRLAYRSAIEHYDERGAGTAVVRCYEDEFGIAFAGAVTPGTTEEQLFDMRRSPVSGDWRRVGGQLELIGVLSVNSPGFPTPRFATDEAGRTALVAAPSVRPVSEEALTAAAGRRSGLSQEELVARVTARVRAELAAETAAAERARRLAGLAASIKVDPRSRMAALVDRVEGPRRVARVSRLQELAAAVAR